ncbi:hypothetical protein HYX16_01570 [Candidatus Woesearchaeota archaeon]|nr:hypothetical protein [Candidatus Woesearchaeota archaeon]
MLKFIKRGLKINKKGISPLIATILLVGFVVVIGALVILWSRNFITEKAEKEGALAEKQLECENIGIDIKDAGSGFITVENNGNNKIDAFILRVVSDGSGATKVESEVKPLSIYTINHGLSGSKIDLIPALKPEGTNAPLVPCSSKHKIVKIL